MIPTWYNHFGRITAWWLIYFVAVIISSECKEDAEKTKKFVLVKAKTTVKNGKTQLGFHDGKTLLDDTQVSVGDTCVLQTPEIKILEIIKLEKGLTSLEEVLRVTNADENVC